MRPRSVGVQVALTCLVLILALGPAVKLGGWHWGLLVPAVVLVLVSTVASRRDR